MHPPAVHISHESIRQWCLKFGGEFAAKLRRRRPKPGDTWHLDEVAIKIAGVQRWLWRAVDQSGMVLDVLVQSRRDNRSMPSCAVRCGRAATSRTTTPC